MGSCVVVLLTYPYPYPVPQWQPLSCSISPTPNSRFRIIRTNYRRRWDSNAETFRSQNSNFQRQHDHTDTEHWLQEFIDHASIFKAFKSYGLMLPAIILSLLLATGPKAFLMALALPLGQSVFALAFRKVWGKTQNNPKRKAKTKKKPRGPTVRNFDLDEEEEENQKSNMGSMGYQSWVAGNNVPGDKGTQDQPNFGGWDELDRQTKRNMGAARKSTRAKFKSKLSRSVRSGTPLLLRLLIAIFPFLGSWTKML